MPLILERKASVHATAHHIAVRDSEARVNRTRYQVAAAQEHATIASLFTVEPRKLNCGRNATREPASIPISGFAVASVAAKAVKRTVATDIKAVISRTILIGQ